MQVGGKENPAFGMPSGYFSEPEFGMSSGTSESGVDAPGFTGRKGGLQRETDGSETEKLKRIIANYEHDRARLAKEQPALARSATHEVGHADGSGEKKDLKKSAKEFISDIKIELQMREW